MSATILIVDDEENVRLFISTFLTSRGYEILEATTLEEARCTVQKGMADIILLDVNLPDGDGDTLLEELPNLPTRPVVILITGKDDIELAVEVMKNGAADFLRKPIRLPQLEKSVQRASEMIAMRRELAHLRQMRAAEFQYVVGSSLVMKKNMDIAQRVAMRSTHTLISGATGTGKEGMAWAIHSMGPRATKTMVDLNCAAFQETMLESELFGHEAGAFTGAEKRKTGLMEKADGSILFLDEISSMPYDMQSKLLRAIDTQTFLRVGGIKPVQVDVQIVAASNKDLHEMIAQGKFRDDLYYRLAVMEIKLPTLKERAEDIPELVGFFIRKFNQKFGINVTDISPRAMKALTAYPWPGNIRELRNAIERAMILCDEDVIDLPDLLEEIRRYG